MWKPANALHSITCPDHLPRSFARLIWATAQRPAVDTRITARHFARAVSPEMPGAACPADGIPSFLSSSRESCHSFNAESSFAVRTEFPSDLRTKPRDDLAGKRRRLTPAVCKQLGSMARSRRFCVESLAARTDASPCSSFKRSCVRWTHTRFVMPIRHRSADTAARPDLPSFTARLR